MSKDRIKQEEKWTGPSTKLRQRLQSVRQRRQSVINSLPIHGFDDGADSMMTMFHSNEVSDDVESNNKEEVEASSQYRHARQHRRQAIKKRINEEMLLQKISECREIIENVKNRPWSMSRKVSLHKKARMFVDRSEGRLSRGQGYRHRAKQILRQLCRMLTNLWTSLIPWEMQIKRIESHFGSVVASYFVFLRWLLWISLWLALIQAGFIMAPELLAGGATGSSGQKKIPEAELKTAYDLDTLWDAEGILKYSVLFYGYYGNSTTIGQVYRLPLAYLLTNMMAFVYSFVVVINIMTINAQKKHLLTNKEETSFTMKLFTEWDFMIGSRDTALNKHASIATTFKEAILEEEEKVKDRKKWLTFTLRLVANVIICVLLALSGYIVSLFVERSRGYEILKSQDPDYVSGFWQENELTIVMTVISTLFPPILEILSPLEKLHPRTSLRLMLARIFALNLLNLYTLFIALYYKQSDLREYLAMLVKNETYYNNCSSTSNNMTDTTTTTTATTTAATYPPEPTNNSYELTATARAGASSTDKLTGNLTATFFCVNGTIVPDFVKEFCWETMIGQEVFKLTIMDTVFVLGQTLVQDVLRTYLVRYFNPLCCWDMEKHFPEYPEFKTAENLLALISNQGVIWLGTFFNPGLPLLNLLKLLVLMYVRCWTVLTYTVPEARIFRASRSNNFYYTLLLVMLFLCMLPPLFAVVAVQPSPQCGPFSGQDRMFDVLTDTIKHELPAVVDYVLMYVASPGVILPVLMLLGMFIYYLASVARSLRVANRELRLQLVYERTEGRRQVYAMADAKHGELRHSANQMLKPAKSQVDLKSHVGKGKEFSRAATSILGVLGHTNKSKTNSAEQPRTSSVPHRSMRDIARSLRLTESSQFTDRNHWSLTPQKLVTDTSTPRQHSNRAQANKEDTRYDQISTRFGSSSEIDRECHHTTNMFDQNDDDGEGDCREEKYDEDGVEIDNENVLLSSLNSTYKQEYSRVSAEENVRNTMKNNATSSRVEIISETVEKSVSGIGRVSKARYRPRVQPSTSTNYATDPLCNEVTDKFYFSSSKASPGVDVDKKRFQSRSSITHHQPRAGSCKGPYITVDNFIEMNDQSMENAQRKPKSHRQNMNTTRYADHMGVAAVLAGVRHRQSQNPAEGNKHSRRINNFKRIINRHAQTKTRQRWRALLHKVHTGHPDSTDDAEQGRWPTVGRRVALKGTTRNI